MRIIQPSYYKDFRCIAGACLDSCCQGWEVDADEDSLAYYRTLNPSLEIRRRIDSVLDKDEFGNTIFTLAPKKRCPFLNAENLCDMHIAIGGEHTPLTCRMFPRFAYDYGGTREIGISFSCPVAAELIYELKNHLSFEESFTDELPALNDIDAELFMMLKNARNQAFQILWNDDVSVKQRLMDLLRYAETLQGKIGTYKEGGNPIGFFDVFKNPELINPEWEEKVSHPARQPIADTYANENIAAYFVYKYFMQAVYDRDVLSKVKMAAVGVLLHTCFGGDAWTVHLWSKETEHSQYNMDRFQRLLKEADCLSTVSLRAMINER